MKTQVFFQKAVAVFLVLSVLILTGLYKIAVVLFILYLIIEGVYRLYLILNEKDNDFDDGKRD